MTMIEVKTADLIGPALDWAVAVATGYYMQVYLRHLSPVTHDTRDPELWRPSVNWAHGGPLIEKFGCDLKRMPGACWAADTKACKGLFLLGDTPLQAVCRAIVRSHFLCRVQVPKELMP